ncbi:hypothetical protein X737_32930 [Mesorhizobium sp. L48C026A00]|nr:hypothetical protein X737_32930 [Mesorhizobium sp. L48C026A00]
MIETEIVLGALETLFDRPAQPGSAGQIDQSRLGRCKHQIIAEGRGIGSAFADENIAGIAFVHDIGQSNACPVTWIFSLPPYRCEPVRGIPGPEQMPWLRN